MINPREFKNFCPCSIHSTHDSCTLSFMDSLFQLHTTATLWISHVAPVMVLAPGYYFIPCSSLWACLIRMIQGCLLICPMEFIQLDLSFGERKDAGLPISLGLSMPITRKSNQCAMYLYRVRCYWISKRGNWRSNIQPSPVPAACPIYGIMDIPVAAGWDNEYQASVSMIAASLWAACS